MRSEAITWAPNQFVSPHDYLFFTGQVQNASSADYFCAVAGGTLAIVNSAKEQDFLANEMRLHGGGTWWIGYSDSTTEGLWRWADGATSGYVNWAPGQPANVTGNEDCAAVDASSGQWTAEDCGGARNFVCEHAGSGATSSGTFSYSAADTNWALQNYEQFAVTIHRGLTVGTCGLANASNSGDTFLRVFDQNGVEVAEDDDACGAFNLASNVSVGVLNCANGCTWVIHAGCFSSDSCSGTVAYQPY